MEIGTTTDSEHGENELEEVVAEDPVSALFCFTYSKRIFFHKQDCRSIKLNESILKTCKNEVKHEAFVILNMGLNQYTGHAPLMYTK